MNRCEGCGSSIAPIWKFCIYCGRPQHGGVFAAAEPVALATQPVEPIPAALRPESDDLPRDKKYDAPFWVGISMGALGLALIIYAATQIYTVYV